MNNMDIYSQTDPIERNKAQYNELVKGLNNLRKYCRSDASRFFTPQDVADFQEYEQRYIKAIDRIEKTIRQQTNISNRVVEEQKKLDADYKAKRYAEMEKMNPVEYGLSAMHSAGLKVGGGALKAASDIGMGLTGWTARALSGDEGNTGAIGRDLMQKNRDFKSAVDEFISLGTGFDSSEIEGIPGSVIRAGEGLVEMELPMAAVSGVSGLTKLSPLAKTGLEGAMLGLQNIPAHSDYIEQTSGKFKPLASALTGMASGELMSYAFYFGRTHGMSERAAMNFAKEVASSGIGRTLTEGTKQGLKTALLNSVMNGGLGTGMKEYAALSDNATEEDINRAYGNITDALGHEFIMGLGFGFHGGVKETMQAKQRYREMVKSGKEMMSLVKTPEEQKNFIQRSWENTKNTFKDFFSGTARDDTAFDRGVAKYFLDIERQTKLADKEKFDEVFEGSEKNLDDFIKSIQDNVPEEFRKNPAVFGEALDAFKDSLVLERNFIAINRFAEGKNVPYADAKAEVFEVNKQGKVITKDEFLRKTWADEMKSRLEELKQRKADLEKQKADLDQAIKDKNTTFEEKQNLAKQKEEVQAQEDEVSRRIQTPYTRAEVIESVRDLVARKYKNNPQLLEVAMNKLSDFISNQNSSQPIGVDDAIGLLIQIDGELSRLNPDVKFDSYNPDIEDIISPKLIGSDKIYANDERKAPPSVIDNQRREATEIGYNQPKQIGYDGSIPLEDTRNLPSSAISDNRRVNPMLEAPQGNKPSLLEYKSQMDIPRSVMNISEGSNQPTNTLDVGEKVTRESPSSFDVRNLIATPKSTENVPPKNKMKIDSTDKVGNKAVRDSESFDTKADMPKSVLSDRTESPAIKNERGRMGLDVEMKQKEAPKAKAEPKAEAKPKVEVSTEKKNPLQNETVSDLLNMLDNSKVKSKTKSEIKKELKRRNKIAVEKDLNEIKTVEEADRLLRDFLKTRDMFGGQQSRASDLHKRLLELERLNKESKLETKPSAEKPRETKAKADFSKKVVTGKKTNMTTKASGGMNVDGHFGIVDVNDLQTSTKIGETQNRNRETLASQAQVNSIANNPNPEYLIVDNPDSANGAMVITADGKVLSGNGRTLGLQMAYKYGNGKKYKAYLKEHAKEFGIDPKQIDKVKNPVLVRIIDPKEGFDVKRFVKESNESRQLGRNAAEIARTDAENIKGILRELNTIDNITSPSNKEFIQKFFDKTVGDSEKAQYLAEDGSLTPDGQRRIENALIASMYGNNPRLIEKLTNTTNEGIKNIANALIATAKDGAKLKGEIDKGIYFDVDMTKEIGDAAIAYADTVAEMKRQGVNGSPINFYLANMKDRLSPEAKLVFGMLSELHKSSKQTREFLQIMNDVIRGHGDPQQGDLFTGKAQKPSNAQIVKEALQEFDSRYKTDFSKQDLSKWNKSERTLFDLSKAKDKATNPISDKELNNFLNGQAKQITKDTGLKFKVVDSVEELSKIAGRELGDTTEAGIQNDTVYIVRGNVDRERFPIVIAHEVAGHRGVEALFDSKAKMDAFFNSLERAASKDKFIRDAFAEVDRLGYKENRSREAMAKIVERVKNESGTLKGTAKTFVNFITSRVRRLLRRMGFKNLQLNEAEVYDLAVQALRRTGLKNSNKFFGLDRFFAKDNSFLSATSTELDKKYPGWRKQTNKKTGAHSSQIEKTRETYQKLGNYLKENGYKDAKILDASSGLGVGTQDLRDMGFDVEDIEPYPGINRKTPPTYGGEDYLDYTKVYRDTGKTYDVIISNAVLNVIPDDWRANNLHAMADVLLKKGGKLFINVRDYDEVRKQKQKIELDSPNETLVLNNDGSYRAYQIGFRQPDFEYWVRKELGKGYTVETTKESNSGLKSGTRAVVITKNSSAPTAKEVRDSITKRLSPKQLANREFNNSAEPMGNLKTLQSGNNTLGRYKDKVGKLMQGLLYVHKNYADEVIPNDKLNRAKQILAEKDPNFKYNSIMYDEKKNTIRFDEAPNFDTAPEPIPGNMVAVNLDTGEISKRFSGTIWHHKWQWVKDDYKGFDTRKSWERSREWLNGIAKFEDEAQSTSPYYEVANRGTANGNAFGYGRWNSQLMHFGLDHLIDDVNNTVPSDSLKRGMEIKAELDASKPKKSSKSKKAEGEFLASIGGKKDHAEEVARKTKEDTMDVRYPKAFDKSIKKILKQNIRQFQDEFMTKKNTGYKDAALKASYWAGMEINQSRIEKAFKSLADFDEMKRAASEYIKDNEIEGERKARYLDKLMNTGSREGVLKLIQNVNIDRQRYVRKALLENLRDNLRELRADKVPTDISMQKFDLLGENFTADELNSLLNTNKYSTEAVNKLRRVAQGIADGFADIRANTDIEVKSWAEGNARALAKQLDVLARDMKEGNDPSLNISTEKLGRVNTLLGLLKDNAKKAKEALDRSASNRVVADTEQIMKELKAVNEKYANSVKTNTIGLFNELLKPTKAMELMDNDNFTARFGKRFHEIAYERIHEGQKKQDHYRAEGGRIVDSIVDSFAKDGKSGQTYLDGKFDTVETSEGHKYDISRNVAMSAVATYLDRETRQLIDASGKVEFFLGDKKGSDSFTLTVKDLKKWYDRMTPLEKEALRKGEHMLSNIFLPEMNSTHERLNGAPLRVIAGGYFPRSHVDMEATSNKGLFDATSMPYIHTAMNADYQSILKARGTKGVPQLRLRGFTDTLNNYVDQASLYIGMAEPLRHLNRVLTDGMKKEITQRYGIEYTKRLERMIKMRAGMAGKTESDKNLTNRILSNLAAAKLTPASALKQFSSVFLASSVIDYKYLARAIKDGVSKSNVDEMMKLDEMYLRYRNNGIAGIVPLTAKTWEGERELQKHGDTWWNRGIDKMLNLSIEADKKALGIIYKATKLMAKDQGKANDSAWIEKKFMDAVRRTQNTTDLSGANGFQEKSRESNLWAFLNMYQNQTQKVPNEYFRLKRYMAEAERKYGKDSAQYKEAKGRMTNFVVGAALMNAMMIGVGSMVSSALHKEDDDKQTASQKLVDYTSQSLLNFTGNPILKTALGGSSYALSNALPKSLGGQSRKTTPSLFGSDISGIVPDTVYTMGRISEDLTGDDPKMTKFKKVVADSLSSRAVETSLGLARIPTWMGRYPAMLWKKYMMEAQSRKKPNRSGESDSWSLRRKRSIRRLR